MLNTVRVIPPPTMAPPRQATQVIGGFPTYMGHSSRRQQMRSVKTISDERSTHHRRQHNAGNMWRKPMSRQHAPTSTAAEVQSPCS